MTEIIVNILVQLVSTLAVATKQIKQGRLSGSIFVDASLGSSKHREMFGDNDVEAVLHRLDRLTLDEARTTAAETLEVVHALVENLRQIMSGERIILLCFVYSLLIFLRWTGFVRGHPEGSWSVSFGESELALGLTGF